MIKKTLFLICLLCLVFYYVYVYILRDNAEYVFEEGLPYTVVTKVLNDGKDTLKTDKKIPNSRVAIKDFEGNINEVQILKNRKTPFTRTEEEKEKNDLECISREDVMKAPIIAIIPMSQNGISYELVIVEKNGRYYDASDGVRVFTPKLY